MGSKHLSDYISDEETAKRIREYYDGHPNGRGLFSWPTDSCGYEQHMKFVDHRNNNWDPNKYATFRDFALEYADKLTNKIN
jgi:hypothetical protein